MRLLPYDPTLHAVEANLPFAFDDLDAINRTFGRWIQTGDAATRRSIDIWTYLYVRGYFIKKTLQAPRSRAADLDLLYDTALRRIHDGLASLERPDRYSAWVSVLCLNVYRNHIRTQRAIFSLDDPNHFFDDAVTTAPPTARYDDTLEMRSIQEALADLPEYLREIARLRFLEGLSYKEMSARTDLPLPRLRAYAGKIRERLQKNPLLRSFYEELGDD